MKLLLILIATILLCSAASTHNITQSKRKHRYSRNAAKGLTVTYTVVVT